MIRAIVSVLLLTPAALVVGAPVTSPVQAQDSRLVGRLYDPTEVVRIDGRIKVQATIAFDEDERIENVAIGDSQAWQVTPNKRANLLFVKPLSPTARTNMTVITDQRTYLFDLIASPRAKPLYVLRFTYPEEPTKAPPPQEPPDLTQRANATEISAATDPYAVIDPARLNFKWTARGDASLLPLRIYDDGNAVFLKWANGTAVPAILIKDAEGTEGPVNFTVRGDTIVVDNVPAEIVLRSGNEVAGLINAGPVRPSADVQELVIRENE